jgi:hypothetical protein
MCCMISARLKSSVWSPGFEGFSSALRIALRYSKRGLSCSGWSQRSWVRTRHSCCSRAVGIGESIFPVLRCVQRPNIRFEHC